MKRNRSGTDEAEEYGLTNEEYDDTEEEWKTAQIRRYFENIQEKELGLMENVYECH